MSSKKKAMVSEETNLDDAMNQLNPAATEVEPENSNLPSSPAAPAALEEVAIADLICDERTQVRAAENEEAIENYAEAMKNGAKFPHPIVFRDEDGKLWVSEGHHTVKAHRRHGAERVTAEVRKGTAKDARMFAYAANTKHGVQLTNADKRKIVEGLIKDTGWGNLKIAKHIGFWSDEKVRGIRREMEGKTWRKKAAPIANPENEGDAGVVNVAEAIEIDKIAEEEGEVILKEVASEDDGEPSELFIWKKRKPGPAMDQAKLRTIAEQLVSDVEASGYSVIYDEKTRTVSVAIKRGAVIAAYHCQVLMENVIDT